MATFKRKASVWEHLSVTCALLAIIVSIISIKLGHTRVIECEVQEVEKISNTHGSSDSFSTEPKYYVHTNAGVFIIELSGLNSYPYGLHLIGKDLPKTMMLKTRGARWELVGWYPNIIEVIEEDWYDNI